MKKYYLLLLAFCSQICLFAQSEQGSIKKFNEGIYQIIYPNQSIDIFFNYSPSYTIASLVEPAKLTEAEQELFAKSIRDAIAELPNEFIKKHLGVEIYPSSIKNDEVYGYHFMDQIVIDAEKHKVDADYSLYIKTLFMHELGHIIEEDRDIQKGAKELKDYLEYSYLTNKKATSSETSLENGFISIRAHGTEEQQYDASEEFSEIFSHMLLQQHRGPIMDYVSNNPNSILTSKIDRFIEFSDEFLELPSSHFRLSKPNYDFEKPTFTLESLKNRDYNPGVKQFDPGMDGDKLLEKHEMKSYESFDFSDEKYLEQRVESISDELDQKTGVDDNVLEQEPEYIQPLYSESPPPYEFDTYAHEPYYEPEPTTSSNQKEKKNKRSKRKKGTGLMIAAGLIYLTLEILSN